MLTIGVSLDDEESELRDYLEKNEIPWRQIFSAAKGGRTTHLYSSIKLRVFQNSGLLTQMAHLSQLMPVGQD